MLIQNEYSTKGKKWQVSVLVSLITSLLHNDFFFRKKWTVMKSMKWNLRDIKFIFPTKYMHNIRLLNCCHFILFPYIYLSICTWYRGTSQIESLGHTISLACESSHFQAGASANAYSHVVTCFYWNEYSGRSITLKEAIVLMCVH